MNMPAAGRKGILLTLRRLARERRAVSAVEFALILPVMLTLFLGGTEITQGITIKRKTTIATRTIGDLIARATEITNDDMTKILGATTAVLAPYSAANLKIIVSSIAVDANGAAKIVWSDATANATAHPANQSVTLPTGTNADGNVTPSLGLTNATLIWAEAEYTYTPAIGYVVTGSLALKDKVYLRPRLVSCIKRNTGSGTPLCS
jgi:Flp pilus assembly protein TadG